MKLTRPSPSMVVACIALFVALGGSAIAARALITSPSQIRNGVITSAKVKNGSLLGADMRSNTISSAQIRDNGILERDLSAGLRNRMGVASSGPTATELVRKAGPESGPGPADVMTLPALAPGAYAIFAKTTLASSQESLGLGEVLRGTKSNSGACTLTVGDDVDDARHPVLTPYSNQPQTLNLQMTRTIAAPTDVKLACSASETPWRASDSSIIVMRLSGATRSNAG